MGVHVGSEQVNLQGPPLVAELVVPARAIGLVLVLQDTLHGMHPTRSLQAVDVLHAHRLATLALHLLTQQEAGNPRNGLNGALLTRRMGQALDWVDQRADLKPHRLGLLGAHLAAAAALSLAAARPHQVVAVVAQDARLALSWNALPQVQAPTLLVVGAHDLEVLAENQAALRLLGGPKRLEVVPGATLGLAEPAAREGVFELAASWFEQHLRPRREA